MREAVEQRLERVKAIVDADKVEELNPGDFYFAWKQGLLEKVVEETRLYSHTPSAASVPSVNKETKEVKVKTDVSTRDKEIRESNLSNKELAAKYGLSTARIYKIRKGVK